ncbi:hypothetical protein T492DRAFT_1102432 [Pavlovales sp. CCMP2436]|nr:hypothetical protein T492DRAFT_1102432 [Pavlovales sp. CCMP2436]
MGAMQSTACFAQDVATVCIVYPHSHDEACASCNSNEWSHRRPRTDPAVAVPRQLTGRVPHVEWVRLLNNCYAATELDFRYYKFGFGALLLVAVLLLLILSPTVGLFVGGPVAIGVFLAMSVISRLLALRLNGKLARIVESHRPVFEQGGCVLNWRQAWVGGIEAASRYVWIEVRVMNMRPEEVAFAEGGTQQRPAMAMQPPVNAMYSARVGPSRDEE